MSTNSVDLTAINNILKKNTQEFEAQKAKIEGMFTFVNESVESLSSDFNDDKKFNLSSGKLNTASSLNMSKIKEMNKDEIKELLKSTENTEEIQEELQKQKALYSQFQQQYKKLQAEISQMQSEINALIVQLEDAQNEQEKTQSDLKDAQKESKNATNNYDKAIKDQHRQEKEAQNRAYKEALEEFQNQEGENEKIPFTKFYNKKLGDIDVSDSGVKKAKDSLDSANYDVRKFNRKLTNDNSAIQRLQTNLNAKQTAFTNKQTEVGTLVQNVETVQNSITILNQKIADIAFIENNRKEIESLINEDSTTNEVETPITITTTVTETVSHEAISGVLVTQPVMEPIVEEVIVEETVSHDAISGVLVTQPVMEPIVEEVIVEETIKHDAISGVLVTQPVEEITIVEEEGYVEGVEIEGTKGAPRPEIEGMIAPNKEDANLNKAKTDANLQNNYAKYIQNKKGAYQKYQDYINTKAQKANQTGNNTRTKQTWNNYEEWALANAQSKKTGKTNTKAQKTEVDTGIDGNTINFAQTDPNATSLKDKINSAITGDALLAKRDEVAYKLADVETELANIDAQITAAKEAQDDALVQELETKKANLPAVVDKLSAQLNDYDFLITSDFKGISDKEWAYVEKKCDLTEKLKDGSPRYIIAVGDYDNQFHVYDMKQNGYAVVREGQSSKNNNIVSQGNGHVNDLTQKDSGDGNVIFYLENEDNLSYGNACYRTTSPLSLDLNGDGVQTKTSTVKFDIDGDGFVDTINDSADAVLVFDKDKDGKFGEDGSECFGNVTDLDGDNKADGYKDGFEALKALAKKEGLINGEDDNVLDEKDLNFLELSYGLKIKANGYNSEAQSLADLGITQINLAKTDETTLIKDFDGQGNELMKQEGATFIQNGVEKEYADIWHVKKRR